MTYEIKEIIMSAGITRLHGTAQPGVFTGGYQITWLLIADDSINYSTGYTAVGSNFELAVRGVEALATVVVLGTPTSAGFMVGVDAATFFGRGDSTGYTETAITAAADLAAAVKAATASGGNVTAVNKVISGASFA